MIGNTISHYKILEKLGEGGMGVVYKAEDQKLKRIVALKFLPPELTRDPEAKERFVQEAQAASALDHANICTIYEIGATDDGQMYISMACYTGETLKERIDKGPFPIEDAVGIAAQIARGLAKAHAKGIIHRDIKPANIFVTEDNDVKICDFGLAKLAGQTRLTKAGTTLGTVAHMSPEQTTGSEVNHRSDIWALGVVLYEMISGKLPFAGEHEQAVMYSVVNREPEPLTALRTGVPMELEGVVTKCLEKDPADRYQHVDDVIVDLNRQTKQMREPYDTPSRSSVDIPAKRRSIDRRVAGVLIAIAIVVVAYAVYWQLTFFDKKQKAVVPVPGKKMLVVLPFENLGPPDVEYFADGVTEEITSRLAALSGLGVISRTSSFQYKNANKSITQIGEELGVDYVLEGTVRWDKPAEGESRVRVTPQLIRVSDDTHLWSDRYDRVLRDIFSVQTEIATQVIEQLNVTLLEPERTALEARPTDNMDAYQAYLRGRDYMGRAEYTIELWRLTIDMYERAVEMDPEFALAYTALAYAHSNIFNMGVERTQDHVEATKAAVDRALALQPELPEAHVAMGYYYYHCLRDYDRALEAFDEAGTWLPNQNDLLQHIGWIRRRQSRWDESLDHLKRSLELNPRDASLCRELANTYGILREYQEAERYYDRSIAIAPDQVASYVFKALSHWLRAGDIEGGRAALEALPLVRDPFSAFFWSWQLLIEGDHQAALERISSIPVDLIEMPGQSFSKTQLTGTVYQLMGETERAQASFISARDLLEKTVAERPEDARIHSALGIVYAALRQKDDALREGKRAVEMIPVSEDALRGPHQIENLALIYMLLGELDAAVDQIDYLLSIPSFVSVPFLRVLPIWDPIRDYPPFEAVLKKHSRTDT